MGGSLSDERRFPPFNILSKAPINSVDDLNGMKVRSFGGLATLVSRLGAVSVSLPTPEVYTALQRGTVDAATYPPLLIVDFKFYEAAKYLWDQPLGSVVSVLAMRKAKWDALPDDLKEIFRDRCRRAPGAYHRIVQTEGNEEIASKVLADAGVEVTRAAKRRRPASRRRSIRCGADWIAEMAGNGLPGQEIADKFRALLDKYSTGIPN